MAKVKVILADLDEKYLAPIEMKFLEELDDEIELEIITQESYFDEYFSQPRSVDILVVDEELYNPSLQRHNISNLFILAEHVEEGGTEDLLATRLFKYTSIKEIYNQIIAASASELSSKSAKAKETRVILFTSASGGTGKTTLALGVAACLAKSFKKVLYINIEGINSFQYMLSNRAAVPSSAYQEFKKLNSDLFNRIRHVIRNEKFDYLPPFGAALSSLGIQYGMYKELIQSVKLSKEYDAIIVDTDAIFNESKAELIMLADKVVMVLNQTKASVFATNMLTKNMNCNDVEKFYFICNKYSSEKENYLINGQETLSFIVTDYVYRFVDEQEVLLNGFEKNADMQKISVLVM